MATPTPKIATKSNAVPKGLADIGFELADPDPRFRMLVASDGRDKTGKSNFFLTAPGPIAIINLDIGLEGMVEKFAKVKGVWIKSYNIPVLAGQGEYKPHWEKIKEAYEMALGHPDVRTVAIDTGTDLWELTRLAAFGTNNPTTRKGALDYVECNAIYRGYIKSAYNTDKNLIITHKVDKKWVKSANSNAATWDGTFERQGFAESGYLIQVNIEHVYDADKGKFGIKIQNCRQNMSVAGMELWDEECNFSTLGQTVYDSSTAADWQ